MTSTAKIVPRQPEQNSHQRGKDRRARKISQLPMTSQNSEFKLSTPVPSPLPVTVTTPILQPVTNLTPIGDYYLSSSGIYANNPATTRSGRVELALRTRPEDLQVSLNAGWQAKNKRAKRNAQVAREIEVRYS